MRSVNGVAVMEMKCHVAIVLHCGVLEDTWKRVEEIGKL